MTTVFKVFVHEHITAEGLLMTNAQGELVTTLQGETATIEGRRIVLLDGGHVVAADGFHETKSEALAAAADRAEQIGRRIIDQAHRLRKEATA